MSGVPLSLQDLWTKGNDKFIAGKIGEVRATAAERERKKTLIQKEVFERADKRREASLRTEVGVERNRRPSIGMRALRALLTRRRNERLH